MSLDSLDYYRRVYSWGDYISDLGGLFGALSPLCYAVLTIINFYSSYQFLMDELFVTSVREYNAGMRKIEQK